MKNLRSEIERECRHCHKMKPLSEFGRHKYRKDGLNYQCKPCQVQISTDSYYRHKDKERADDKIRTKPYSSEPKVRNAANMRYYARYPEKEIARRKLREAVYAGKIEKFPCMVCGDKKSNAHHPAYELPFDVIWLCLKHHAEYHSIERRAKPIRAKAEESLFKERTQRNVGMLRQWLNEDRITDPKKMVTNEEIETWLSRQNS